MVRFSLLRLLSLFLAALALKLFFSSAYDNWKVAADVEDRRVFDEQQFRDSGASKPKRTFKFDPSKPIVRKKK